MNLPLLSHPSTHPPTHPPIHPHSFTPQKGIAYDPRHLVGGTTNELDGTWVSGFFDKGSFMETLAGWAKTVSLLSLFSYPPTHPPTHLDE